MQPAGSISVSPALRTAFPHTPLPRSAQGNIRLVHQLRRSPYFTRQGQEHRRARRISPRDQSSPSRDRAVERERSRSGYRQRIARSCRSRRWSCRLVAAAQATNRKSTPAARDILSRLREPAEVRLEDGANGAAVRPNCVNNSDATAKRLS